MSTIDPGPESNLRRRIAEREYFGFDASTERRALRRLLSEARATPCAHRDSVTTPDGNGAYCATCGETLA